MSISIPISDSLLSVPALGEDAVAVDPLLLGAFVDCLKRWREARQPEAAGAWHAELLENARRLLEWGGVALDELELRGGVRALQINANKGNSALNDFAHEVADKLDGLSLVYSPIDLIGGVGYKTTAKYNRRQNRIFLPHQFVGEMRVNETIQHEILHAVFNSLLKKGQDSLFLGRLEAVDARSPMWASNFYPSRLSFEELATHPLTIRLIAAEWMRELQGVSPDAYHQVGQARLAKLEEKGRVFSAVSGETAQVLGEFATALEASEFPLRYINRPPKSLKGESVSARPILWARSILRNIDLKIPLMAPDHQRWFAERESSVEAAQGLRQAVRSRLMRQREVSVRLHAETDAFLERIRETSLRMIARTAGREDLQSLYESAIQPRRTTLEVMLWPPH